MASNSIDHKLPLRILGADLYMNTDSSTLKSVGKEAPVGSIVVDSGKVFQKYGTGNTDWKDFVQIIAEARGDYDPSGFVNRTGSSLSYVQATRTLTLVVPSAQKIFVGGAEHTLTGDISVQHSDTTGMHYFYIDSTHELKSTTIFDTQQLLYRNALVAMIYWNADQGVSVLGVMDERHGLMDPHVHEYLHMIFGAQWASGVSPGDFDSDNKDADSGAQFSVSSGVIRDEDIPCSIAAVTTTGNKRVVYRSGATAWRVKSTLDSFPVMQGGLPECTGTRLNYNPRVAGSSSLAEVPNKKVIPCFVLAANNGEPLFVVAQNYYDDINKTLEGVYSEWETMVLDGLPLAEYKLCSIVLYKTEDGATNSVKAYTIPIDATSQYIDTRSSLNARLVSVASHQNLPGLDSGRYLDGGHTNLVPIVVATVDPTVNNDIDTVKVGTLWVNSADDTIWICTSNVDGAAKWATLNGRKLWTASTYFRKGDCVFHRGIFYWVTASHTSGTTFLANGDKVEPMTPGVLVINSVSHGFVAKNALYQNGADWVKARANNASTLSDPPAIVIESNEDWFILASGVRFVDVPSHGLTAGEVYYVSGVTAGELTATEPTTFSNPIVRAMTSDGLAVLPYRPIQTV